MSKHPWYALRELTMSPLQTVIPMTKFRSTYKRHGGDRRFTVSRQKTMQVFDVTTGKTSRLPMCDVDALVKRSIVSRASSDALLKDKKGKITHEVWDYSKYIRWVEEHPETPADCADAGL